MGVKDILPRKRAKSMTQQAIRRGILQSLDSSSYTATVLIIEATNYVLSNVPIAMSVDGTSAIAGASCAVLFFDESNHADAVVIAVYPNNNPPTPAPGRTTFLSAPVQEINASTINAGVTTAFTMSSLPAGVLGILYKVFFTSPTNAAFIQIAPHGGAIGNYAEHGNLSAASATHRATGIVAVDNTGKIDIKANTGNCTLTFYVYGYIF